MNDRLAELQANLNRGPEQVTVDWAKDPENPPQEKTVFLDDFFANVDELKRLIDAIKSATQQIKVLGQKEEVEVNKQREKAISDELNAIVTQTNRAAREGKELLSALKEDSTKGNASEKRIKSNLFTTLTRKFIAVTQDYQNAQSSYKTGIQKKVKRTVKVVMDDASEEEINAVIESGSSAGEVLQQAVLHKPAAVIENAYNAINDKYQDVVRLEASIRELHQMFLDFALLVEQQGELLDRIQNQVEAAYDDFEKGNENIEKAIESSKKVRKKQCCIIVIVIIVVIILLFALGVLA
ncbi:unnamed protein product [Heterosigma akashiwo]|uniref:t-SNARE coiled-coil homology domain-containing protein n=1 Tax=Heterosigma akashiwo TaxID=2829 RepID=A0A6V3EEY6_HETAK|eukprot:CAMPEP_0194582372 /NCGR_PEP_ID=MMETSP0292-20121207/15557_1 /TAXON_ID=39354 /ORGANISM="Heterosigma akashiwo, Strain CCMP2393" /LENGTH=295 /DNA_ID=CAMNT_0039436495 /DNA_START=24 /DNA_END=911 /DNA_ORIENTATION=+